MRDLKLQKKLFEVVREAADMNRKQEKEFDAEFEYIVKDLVTVLASTLVAGSLTGEKDEEDFSLLLHKTVTQLKDKGHFLYSKAKGIVSVEGEEN